MSTEVLTRPAVTPDGDGDVHILDGEASPVEAYVWTVLCGEQCFAWDDGEVDPPGFDFFLLGHGHEKATCKRCLAAVNEGGDT